MNNRVSQFSRSIAACGFALSLSASAIADTITLKTAARQRQENATITLGEIALLEGEEALRLASTTIATLNPSASQPLEISVSDVRRALDAAGANWAKINLSGRAVIVRPLRASHATGEVDPPQAMNAAAIEASPSGASVSPSAAASAFTLDTVASEQTVRAAIVHLILAQLRIDPRDLRLRFDERDTSLLQTPLSAGRFEVQPLGALTGDRLAFIIRAWNGAAIESKGQVTLIAERQISVSRAARDLGRGEVVADSDLATAAMWLSHSEAMLAATPAAIVGRSLTRGMKAGETIRLRDIERIALVKRGDLCTVRCLVGGVAISLQAEAKADGTLGDAIEFRKAGERESFLATITAANEAIVNLARK